MKLELLKNIDDLETLKKEYKKLAYKYHPDKGGSVEMMQKLNGEYDYLSKNLNKETGKKYDMYSDALNMYKEVIDRLIKIDDITIEFVGDWLWVSGNTKPIRKELKEMKFFWNKTRELWQKKPQGYERVRFTPSKLSTDDLKNSLGYEVVQRAKEDKENKKEYKKIS